MEQYQWHVEESTKYSHPLDAQLFADLPIFRLLGDIKSKLILDIGCGNGYLLRKFRANGAYTIGIDSSEEMVHEAKKLETKDTHIHLCVASADYLPFVSNTHDIAICSLTINNFPSAEMCRKAFIEAVRILKPGGVFIISVPHPHTLDARTRYRWTEWEHGQNQTNLVPGESFKRKIMGIDGSMLSIANYYWPKEVLIAFAVRAGFDLDRVVEETASIDLIVNHADELDPIYMEVPFFLIMRFIKR